MSHTAEEWTDRFGRQHTSCGECEEAWPCRESGAKPAGWLIRYDMLDPQEVITVAAHGFGVTVDDLVGPSRAHHVVRARSCAMAVVRKHTNWSYPIIGRLFHRDHTTVMHHVEKVDGDPELTSLVQQIVREMRPPERLFSVHHQPTTNPPNNPPTYSSSDPQSTSRTIAI